MVYIPLSIQKKIIRDEFRFKTLESQYYTAQAVPTTIDSSNFIPTFKQPTFEPEQGLLIACFHEAISDTSAFYHLVFTDEVAPNKELDKEYRKIRAKEYGRIRDVESVEIKIVGGKPKLFHFENDAAFGQPYETSIHFKEEPKYTGIIHSQTWNHLLGAYPNLLILLRGGYKEVTPKYIKGSRQDAEAY